MCKYLCLNQGYYVERDNTFCPGRNLRKHHLISFSPPKQRQAASVFLVVWVTWETSGAPFSSLKEAGFVCFFSEALLGCLLIFCLWPKERRGDSSLPNFKEAQSLWELNWLPWGLASEGKKGHWTYDIEVHHLLDIPVETNFIFEIREGQNWKVYHMSAPGLQTEGAFSVPSSFFFLTCGSVFSDPASHWCVAVGRWPHMLHFARL